MIDYTKTPGRERKKQLEYKDYQKVISIVTPSYNSTDKIFELANSILNQTYPYYEWLIIDDGSTKKESLERLKKVEKLDTRIRVFHKENEGLSRTRDFGVKVSAKETKYVVFIDDDDLLDPTYLECAYFSMSTYKDASWCYTDVLNFEGMNVPWNKKFSSETMKHENLLVSTAMVKKDAYYDAGGFKLEGNGFYEDWIFWLKLLAKNRFPIHMSYYGFWYRRKAESGQLQLAHSNHERNMKQIAEYAKRIKEDVKPIEFPRENYEWDGILDYTSAMVFPKFEKEKKHILVMAPWMVLGGADKFNYDFCRLLDKEKYRITFVTTQPTEYIWRQKFEEVCDEVFDLTTFLDRQAFPAFLKYLMETRQIDLILNTNSQYGYVMLPYLKALYPNVPIMDYIHMEEWYNRNGGYSRDSAAVGSVLSKTLFCNKNSEQIMMEYFKRDSKTVGTVYIGVDTEVFDPKKYQKEKLKEKYQIPEGKTIVSYIARIDYQKRPFLLLEIIEQATKQNPEFFFVVAGDGPLLKKVQAKAKKKHLKNILFLGSITTPAEIYAISDITLNCSIKEGLALTSYESLSMGVPVISSDVGGQKELISKEVGVIVPCIQKETDIQNFQYSFLEIDSYVKALKKIKDHLETYQNHARERIIGAFDLNSMKEHMENEMNALMKKPKKDLSMQKHMDIAKELINYYLLQSKEEYQASVRYYQDQIYGVSHIQNEKYRGIFQKYQKIASKLHIPEEAMLFLEFLKKLGKQIKNLILAVIKIPYYCIRFLFDFILLEGKRIYRIIKRKVDRK